MTFFRILYNVRVIKIEDYSFDGEIMKKIWKYTLEPECTLDMPKGAIVLDVQTQNDKPQLWALVDPNETTEERRFCSFCTGENCPDNHGKYIGTFQIRERELVGDLVFHVFEINIG